MRKRWVSVLLAWVMMLSVLPTAAFAEENDVYAPYGEETFFTLHGEDGGVYGASEEEGDACAAYAESSDFIIQDGILKRYTGSAAAVTIPEGVTHIGRHAFSDCGGLISVTIQGGVTSIVTGAFEGCTNLSSVTIPASVAYIGSGAFYGCTDLIEINVDDGNTSYVSEGGVLFNKNETTLLVYPGGKTGGYTIPESVTGIGTGAFYGCTGLDSVTIPDSVTSIGDNAFNGCTSLTSVTIPARVKSLGACAFRGCTGLTSVTISDGSNIWDGVVAIPYGVFEGCTNLPSVTIPKTVTRIEFSAFKDCARLESLTIPENVTNIGTSGFSGCMSLTEINVVPENKNYASEDGVVFNKDKTTLLVCPGGKTGEYTIPEGVTSIGQDAFRGCTGLTGVTIPDSVTSIGGYAFNGCTSLTSVTIPGSVTDTGYGTFNGCTSLTEINVDDGNENYFSEDGILFDKKSERTTLVAYPGGRGDMSYTVPDGVTNIRWDSFQDCTGLRSLNLPSGVAYINTEGGGLSGCMDLTEINVVPENTRYSSIDGVLFDRGKKTLCAYPAGKEGEYAGIPASVTDIGRYAFKGCTGLTGVTIPEGVTGIWYFAFEDCTGLASVTIPDSVTVIDRFAFRGCTGLTGVAIPGSASIGEEAFSGCTGLESVTISAGVTSISYSAFLGCTGLRDVYFDGTKSQWKAINESFDLNNAIIHYGATDIQDRNCLEEMTYGFVNSQDGFGYGQNYNVNQGLNKSVARAAAIRPKT